MTLKGKKKPKHSFSKDTGLCRKCEKPWSEIEANFAKRCVDMAEANKKPTPRPEVWKRLNDVIDVCFSQTNCPECLREWKDPRGCKKGCRIDKAILYMRDLADGVKVLHAS